MFGNKQIAPQFYGELKKPEVKDLHKIFHPFACHSTGSNNDESLKLEERDPFVEYLGR